MNVLEKIRQYLIKVFVRNNKRFPTPVDFDQLDMEARKIFDGAYRYNLDESKGMNLDEGQVMEQTMNKNADQLVDDYLSYEASNIQPTFTKVDERKLPRAEIEALPLKDKEKAEAAVKKKLEAQNVQATQAKEGGETPGGPQRGRPEVVDESYGQTVYIDASEMTMLMDEAARTFKAAEDALFAGNYDEARAILRYEIEDNYKYPQEVRDAAYDARIFVRRGEGMAKDMGYETDEEAIEAMREKIAEGVQKTSKDNWPSFTGRDNETGDYRNIEYVDFLDEPGEDFGTPNSIMIKPEDISYDYANGGRVGFNEGGIGSAKDFIESTGESELMDIYIKVMDGTLPEDALIKALENRGYKTYATGGRVGFSAGGIKSTLMKMFSTGGKKQGARDISENLAELLDIVDQAEKAGIKFNTLKELENFVKATKGVSLGLYKGKMEPVEGVEGLLSGLPKGVMKGEAPKTNLAKVRAKVESDKKGIETLARDEQIPVRDDTSWVDAERTRLNDLISKLKTPMLRGDRLDDLRILDEVEEAGGTEADYNRLRMEKYKGLPSKKEYKRDPEAAEKAADRMFGKNKTKIVSSTLNEDQVRLLGIKEGIPSDKVEEFIKSENGILKRGQARGVVTKDSKGNYYIKDKYSRKYVNAPITADEETARAMAEFMKKNDPEGYAAIQKIVDDINQRRELDDFDVTDRKKNAEGGLNYLMGF